MINMANLTTAICVQVDKDDKEQATQILQKLGLNMSSLINMTLKQVIKRKAVPFEISNPTYSTELENALKESQIIEQEYKDGKRTGYSNANEMVRSILND